MSRSPAKAPRTRSPRPARSTAGEAYLAMLLGQVSDGVVGTDADLRITYWGPGAERMYGFTAAEAIGKTPLDLLRPTYERGERERIIAKIDRQGSAVAVLRTKHKDGTELIVEIHSTRLNDGQGGRGGYVVVYRDVTARHRADEALRAANDRLFAQADELQIRLQQLQTQGLELRAQADVIRTSEAELLGILNATKESIWQFTPDGIILMGNKVALDRFGLTADEAIGRNFAEIVPPELVASRLARLREVAASRRPVEFEDTRAGIIFEHSFYPVFDAKGDVASIACFSRDVTSRRMTEKALEVSRSEAGALIKFAPTGIYEIDFRGPKFLSINDAMCRILGYSREELFALGPGALLDDEGRARFADRLRRQMAGEAIEESVEFRVRKKNGEFIWALLNVALSPNPEEPHKGLVIAHDITERKRMEEALLRAQDEAERRARELKRLTGELETRVRERTAELAAANERLKAEADQRARLVAAVEQADEGVVIMDAEGRIYDVNAAFLRLSRHGRDELRTMTYPQLLLSPGDPDAWANMKISIDRQETWRGRVSRPADGGETLELDITLSPIHDDVGRVISYLAVERDVTREVRLQQHLRQIQKLEALGTLAGGIAHDFNNILNPIFISTELLLLEDSLDPDLRHHLEVTLKAAERGRDLVKQIIAFSRQKEKERRPSKAGPIVAEAVKFLRVSLPSTIEIRSDIGDESDFILGDPAQIHQVVMNLCNNAAYAMRDRGGILSVGLAEIDVDAQLAAQVPALNPGPYLRLTVSDTGTGMTPQVQDRVFDPFFTTKKAGEGSGMGLSVVAGIVRDYGGAVSFITKEDQGTTFEVYLPRLAVRQPESQTPLEELPGGNEHILLIDDEEVQVRSLQSMLTRLGYRVDAQTDGLEALNRLKADPRSFDLLITDQTMPQLTGMRIAEEALALRPDLPIILCTGYSETVDAAGARALGIREFLMKPYSVREMAQTIARALGRGAGPGSSA